MKGIFSHQKTGILWLLLLGCLMVSLLCSVPFVFASAWVSELFSLQANNQLKLFQAVQVFFLLGAPALLFAYFVSKKPMAWLHLQKRPSLMQLFWSTLVYVGVTPVVNQLIQLNEAIKLPPALHAIEQYMLQMEETTRETMQVMLQVNSAFDMVSNWLVAALLAGLVEELFFRGAIQQLVLRSSKRRHPFWGILLTAIIFSAIHMQFYGFFPRMVLGLLMGYLFFYTGNLWNAIYFHVLNNSVALLELHFTQTTTYEAFSMNQFSPSVQALLYIGGTLLACISLLQIKKTASL